MIDIVICDGDKEICAQIEQTLLEYSKKVFIQIDISICYSSERFLEFLHQGNSFDLAFLDVAAGELSGVEVGRQIRKVFKNFRSELVYLSDTHSYDRQLFDVQPLLMIPKPIAPPLIINALKLAMERAHMLEGIFTYQKGHDLYKVPINQIIYFESINREIKLVQTAGADFFYGSLEGIILNTSKYDFIPIHRSYLVNYSHISILRHGEVVMSNGVALPVSRRKREKLRFLHT